MSTEDFSSSTTQDSFEDPLHPPDGDSTPLQLSHLSRQIFHKLDDT